MADVAGCLTVEEYHRLIKVGILNEDDRCELLEGRIVPHERRSPPHEYTRHALMDELDRLVGETGWIVRTRSGVTLSDSEPEPDVVLVRGHIRSYSRRHPRPADFGIITEVADTTLAFDRTVRRRVYGQANLPVYWIVNLVDRQVEVYEQPSGPTASPGYAARRVYKPGDAVPVVLDGNTVGTLAVSDLLP